MSDAASASTDVELQMLGALVNSAFTLSEAFAGAAKAETDHTRRLELFEAFCRGSLAVRMGIRLSMALRAGPKAAPAARDAVEPAELEKPDFETPRERAEPLERERDRDYEPVSLPKFLATLGVVAADAARRGNLPSSVRTETLPTLNALLAQAKAGAAEPPASVPRPAAPTAGVSVLTRPPPVAAKGRLLGSTSQVLPKPLASRPRPLPRGSG